MISENGVTVTDETWTSWYPEGTPWMFGPRGHTAAARTLLLPYLAPLPWGGLTEFAGVPVEVAAAVLDATVAATAGWTMPEGWPDTATDVGRQLLDAATVVAGLVDGVSIAGFFADEGRPDERVTFVAVHVEISDGGTHDYIAALLFEAGLEVMLERHGYAQRMVGRREEER
jgi:hypothetical protein